MGPAIIVTLVIIILLIVAGVMINVRLRRMLVTNRFKRIRRVHTVTSMPDGSVIEKTVVEAVPAESPLQATSSSSGIDAREE